MMRHRVSWVVLAVALFPGVPLYSQEPYANTRPPGRQPDVAAFPGVENMYVPPKPGQPFTGKSVVTWTSPGGGSSHVAFMSMLARETSGKLYFESRRRVTESGDIQPRWNFIIIDMKEKTRTICYVETKTCRINAFRHVVYEDSEETADVPRASTFDSVSLGSNVIDALVVDGRRETTTVAGGAYNNKEPMVITREIWHSPELDLDVSITKTDPRSGTFTRKIEILSRSEPDSEYFAIPSDYTFVDNRPVVKKQPPVAIQQ
jgi:hypothetical protein